MKKLLLLFALFLCIGIPQATMAQNETTVTGRVLDDQGEGIPGVSIQIKGTNSGANTDVDGNFMLKLPEGHDVLVIKSAGFTAQEVKVTNPSQPLVVKLTPSKATLSTISVYGQKIDPKTNTGSVTTVTAKDIERKPITNVIKALTGSPGIQLTSGGGQPGSDPQILVRGFGSLSANSSPLIVVDGVIYNGALSSINPDDVATESLLKDATASSLYGARGANGVILITTKSGSSKNGKPVINIGAQTGIVNNMLPQVATVDQADYYKLAFYMVKNWLYKQGALSSPDESIDQNGFLDNYYWPWLGGKGYNSYDVPANELLNWVNGDINPNAKLKYNEPWLNSLQRTGVRQQYNVSASNGTDKSNYYFSLGYNKDQGIIRYSDFQRITSMLKVDAKITSWLKTGMNISGTYEDQRYFESQTNAYANPFFSAQMIAPIYPVYLHDSSTAGNLILDADGNPIPDMGSNPEYNQTRPFATNFNSLASLQEDNRTNKNYTLRGTTFLEAKFLKDFTATVDYSLEYFNYNNNTYWNMYFGDGWASHGLDDQTSTTQLDYTFRQRLVWQPSFGPFAGGEHSLAVTLDHENYLLNSHVYSVTRSGFTDPIFDQGAAAAVGRGSNSYFSELASESYLALASYDFKKKYFLKASIRRDGTSRFAAQSRWGNFWSAGAGWMISEENFMENFRGWLSTLKVRASYGIQGNEDLGSDYYSWLPNYYFSPNATQPGLLFNSYGNPALHWEGSYMFDPGIDFGFLNNRITGSVDYYIRGSNDLLYVRPFAPSTGIGGIQDNVGSTRNSGIELAVNADVIRSRDFTWNVQLNLQHNKNEVVEMQGADTISGGGTIMTKGLSINSFFMPKYAGVDPKYGDEMWYLADGSTTTDYTIAEQRENEYYVGTADRDLTGSLTNVLTYKQFTLSFQLTFGLGGKYYDDIYANLMGPRNAYLGMAWSPDALNTWTPLHQDADLPALNVNSIGHLSDRFLIDASFLKIQNINLSYNLPERWLKAASFRSASVFVAADNVYLFAARKGVDVESSFFGENSFNYSPYRTVMFGIKLGL